MQFIFLNNQHLPYHLAYISYIAHFNISPKLYHLNLTYTNLKFLEISHLTGFYEVKL